MATQECEAWLVDLGHEAAPEGVALCPEHADRIRVPMGWGLSDERSPVRVRKKRAKKPKVRDDTAQEDTPASSQDVTERPEQAAKRGKPEGQTAGRAGEDVAGDTQSVESDERPVEVEPTPEPAPHDIESDDVAPDDVESDGEGPGDEPPSLQVFEGGDDPSDTTVFHEDGQGALWDSSASAELETDDTTPLLKRAFRVVRDE
jgi:hypothetical protein